VRRDTRRVHLSRRFLILLLFAFGFWTNAVADTSDLWGTNGERWSPQSRLPDFSYAGYHCGEAPLPDVASGVSVKTFGAKGDGETDDTAAFLKALANVTSGAIEVPAGRYRITNILEIKRSGVVLRGAGPDKTILFFPKPLQEIKPNWSATTTGLRTSEYSWAGGLVWFKGDLGGRVLARIIAVTRRGETALRLSTTNGLRVGQRVEIFQTDNADNSLAAELYSGDPGDTRNLKGSTHASLVCSIVKMDGNQIHFDRPLRFDVGLQWHPQIRSFEPTVTESGVENLCFEFPNTPYVGHFTEVGYNAVAFSGVVDCWARNLRITNADSGIFANGRFCTIEGVVYESARKPDRNGDTGHHGFGFAGEDNLLTGFDYRTRFIHDITVDHGAAGNVVANGRGVDLCFDHHERAPYENLFTDIDAGAGTHLWRCGGGAALGKHSGACETFWNIRAAKPQGYPPKDFGPASMNFVALQTDQPSEKNATNRWFEAISPDKIIPQDIHAAQLARRLKVK
jgi:Pectate lyase superfamily protein